MKYHFVCPVWGQRALDIFLNVGLPSQLSALVGFEHFATSRYYIYTTSSDSEVIKSHESYAKLARYGMPVDFIIDEKLTTRSSWWESFTACHHWQTKLADDEDAATFFLCADQIWTERSFTNAAKRIEEGWSAVVCAGPRVNHAVAYPVLRALVNQQVLTVVPRTLLAHAFGNWQHPECRDTFFDSDNYIQYVSYMLFQVPGEGVLGRCYVLHPVVVKSQVKHARPNFVIFDQDYLNSACPDPELIYVVQDSDEICHVSLAPTVMAYAQPSNDRYRDPLQAQAWFAEGAYWGNIHHEFAKRPIYLHWGDFDNTKYLAKWEGVELRSDLIVDSIGSMLAMSDEELLLHYPDNLLRRYSCRTAYGETLGKQDLDLLDEARTLVDLRRHRVWTHPITGQ